MNCPLRRIYSLAKWWTGFQVWGIYAWGGFLSCPQPRSLYVIWNFTQLSTKAFGLDWTVARRVFICRHSKLKQTLRRAPIHKCPWWQTFAVKYVDRSEICMWVCNFHLFFHFSSTFLSEVSTKVKSDTCRASLNKIESWVMSEKSSKKFRLMDFVSSAGSITLLIQWVMLTHILAKLHH